MLLRANHFHGWTNVPLAERLREQLGIPTTLDNDANCAAWGELRAGAGRGARSLVCFTLGTGVGGGIVIDGELWTGANGAAIQSNSAAALAATVMRSNRPNGLGIRPASRRASQLRVKLGTTRPPTSEINRTIAAIPNRTASR